MIILYYQTFTGLGSAVLTSALSHIHLSAVHFGVNPDKTPYIHLNDNPPDNPIFDPVWKEMEEFARLGKRVVLMVGGAGLAFDVLFSDFETYYPMLKETIESHSCITGVDLDIEEYVQLEDVKKLVTQLDKDFGKNFIISMAPVQSSLETNNPGMGGFVYNDLYKTPEGQRIDYFNGQFYGDYTCSALTKAVENGFPPEKIVMGMLSSQFNKTSESQIVKQLQLIEKKYPNFGGVFDWEAFDTYPNPIGWIELMDHALTPPSKCAIC